MRWTWVCLLGGSIGCGGTNAATPVDAAVAIDAAVATDAGVDARTICDPLAKFSPIVQVGGLAMTNEFASVPHLTADELSVYFSAGPFQSGTSQLFVAHRSGATASFEPPNVLPAVNMAFDSDPTVSSDGLELWFVSDRGGGVTPQHLYVATRASTSDDFSTPVTDPDITTTAPDITPFLTADGQQLWFASTRPTSPQATSFPLNIWYATREGKSFTTPRLEPAFAATDQATYSDPVLSADRLTIYVMKNEFASDTRSVWRSHRNTVQDPFPAPALVSELGTAVPGWLSADNCRLYVSAPGTIYIATRQP